MSIAVVLHVAVVGKDSLALVVKVPLVMESFSCVGCRRRNALDIELHHLARQLLLDQRKQHEAAGRLQQLPNVSVNPGKVPARVPTQVPLPDHKGEL